MNRAQLNSVVSTFDTDELYSLHEALLFAALDSEPVDNGEPHDNALVKSIATLLSYDFTNAVTEIYSPVCGFIKRMPNNPEKEKLIELFRNFKATSLNIMLNPAPKLAGPFLFEPVRAAYVDEARAKKNIAAIEGCASQVTN